MEKQPSGYECQGNFLLRLSELGNAPPHIPSPRQRTAMGQEKRYRCKERSF